MREGLENLLEEMRLGVQQGRIPEESLRDLEQSLQQALGRSSFGHLEETNKVLIRRYRSFQLTFFVALLLLILWHAFRKSIL